MPPATEQVGGTSKVRYTPYDSSKRSAKGKVAAMPPATKQAGFFDFSKRPPKAERVVATIPLAVKQAGPFHFSRRPAKEMAAADDDSECDWEPEQAAYSQSEDGDEPTTPPPPARGPRKVLDTQSTINKRKGKGVAAAGDESGSDWEPEQAAYSQSEDGEEPTTPPPPARGPSKVPDTQFTISKRKGKGVTAAGDESGSDWEPEQAAYSQSEDGDEPTIPPPPARDPNRVPEIERQSAISIHKLKAWQIRRLEPIRTEPDLKKPGKELVFYKLRDVVALASAEKYRSPIKLGKRNHIERMRNPTTADLLRKQRAARKANATLNGESSTQADKGESSTQANKARSSASWLGSLWEISSDDDF